jgi:WD40 repeat protein
MYGAAGSVLVLTEGGIIDGYAVDAAVSSNLFAPDPPLRDGAGASSMSLSVDGRWLVLSNTVFEATDGQAIGAASTLREVTRIDTAGAGCADSLQLSRDGTLAASLDEQAACLWQLDSGQLLTKVTLPAAQSTTPSVLSLGSGTAPLRIFRDGVLNSYDLAGKVAASFSLTQALGPEARVADVVFSRDGDTLLTAFVTGTELAWSVEALDAGSGAERWRQSDPSNYARLAVSSDGYVLMSGGQIYDIVDGTVVGKDASGLSSWGSTLGPQGKTKLTLGEQVAAWDLTRPELLRLYGSHVRGVTALDITPDGRYLASHGDWAAVWELKPDFSKSIPLYHGAAPDESWDVALAPDGSSMLVSGDNIGYFRRDGSFVAGDAPPGSARCLSADWAFSPDGCWLAGTHYSANVGVRDARDLSLVTALPTVNCGGGVAFSPDGTRLLTANLELFDTRTWQLQWSQVITSPAEQAWGGEDAVELAPRGDEFVLTRCREPSAVDACSSTRYDFAAGKQLGALPELTGDRVRYSPEGHWLVSQNRLLHVPSGAIREYSTSASVALFTPEGDIVSGESDGSLVRYCRTVL